MEECESTVKYVNGNKGTHVLPRTQCYVCIKNIMYVKSSVHASFDDFVFILTQPVLFLMFLL